MRRKFKFACQKRRRGSEDGEGRGSLSDHMDSDMYAGMTQKRGIRQVTANLPAGLLEEARRVSRAGVTETLKRGLSLMTRSAAPTKASRLRGRLKLDVDLQVSRERPGR